MTSLLRLALRGLRCPRVRREEPEHTETTEHADHQGLVKGAEGVEAAIRGDQVKDRRGGEHRTESDDRDEHEADDCEDRARKEAHPLLGDLRSGAVRTAIPAGPVPRWNGLVYGKNDRSPEGLGA